MDGLTENKRASFAQAVQRSVMAGTLRNVVFHAPETGDVLKAKGVIKQIGGRRVLQMEKHCTEGRVVQENLPTEGIAEALMRDYAVFRKADLNDKNGSASYMTSQKGKVTVLLKGQVKNPDYGMTEATFFAEDADSNDRVKKHLLTGAEPFLRALDIADGNGRVHDKKQAKFRQICRFTEYIKEAVESISPGSVPAGSELYVCDLCCGKSYLSFAAYHCLSEVMGYRVTMDCVDLKQSVIDHCEAVGRACGFHGMRFICMDINAFTPERTPDLVISLHACDVATDIVLDFAAGHGAQVILATPCCHHEMKRNMDCDALEFIARRPVLKQKLCDAATDALRLLKLEAAGYRVDATEFIDPEDTPKNVMLRAHKRKHFSEGERQAKTEEYRATYRFLYGKEPGGTMGDSPPCPRPGILSPDPI